MEIKTVCGNCGEIFVDPRPRMISTMIATGMPEHEVKIALAAPAPYCPACEKEAERLGHLGRRLMEQINQENQSALRRFGETRRRERRE